MKFDIDSQTKELNKLGLNLNLLKDICKNLQLMYMHSSRPNVFSLSLEQGKHVFSRHSCSLCLVLEVVAGIIGICIGKEK